MATINADVQRILAADEATAYAAIIDKQIGLFRVGASGFGIVLKDSTTQRELVVEGFASLTSANTFEADNVFEADVIVEATGGYYWQADGSAPADNDHRIVLDTGSGTLDFDRYDGSSWDTQLILKEDRFDILTSDVYFGASSATQTNNATNEYIEINNNDDFITKIFADNAQSYLQASYQSNHVVVNVTSTENELNSSGRDLQIQRDGTTELTIGSGLVTVENDLDVVGRMDVTGESYFADYVRVTDENFDIYTSAVGTAPYLGVWGRWATAGGLRMLMRSVVANEREWEIAAGTTGVMTLSVRNITTPGSALFNIEGDATVTGDTIECPNLASTAGGSGSERLYVDTSDSNRVKWG